MECFVIIKCTKFGRLILRKIIKICHQMSDFKAKMHQIRFRLGVAPDPAEGAYSAPPDSLAGFKGPTSKGRERGKEGVRKKEKGGKGKVEERGKRSPCSEFTI